MQAPLNRRLRLRCMHVRTRRHPHGLQARVLDHGLVRVVDLDPGVPVVLLCPGELVGAGAADGDDAGSRDALDEGAHVAFAHAAEAGDGDGEGGGGGLRGGHVGGSEMGVACEGGGEAAYWDRICRHAGARVSRGPRRTVHVDLET